jgi:hypothetical protein
MRPRQGSLPEFIDIPEPFAKKNDCNVKNKPLYTSKISSHGIRMHVLNAETTAVVPVRAWVQPLSAVSQKSMIPYRGDERSQGQMRFLGYYRQPGERVSYGPSGKVLQDGRQGVMVDLYV